MPTDTLDQPCDVILVVEDGKEFKAHRHVLSKASPFFEKLLNSDMKEPKEGIVRLEEFSESVMGNTLEFIYTGNVQISAEDNARDLIIMADYLFIRNLKTLAEEVLLQNGLNFSDCFSNYYFSERYRCSELFSKSQKFILSNFSALYAANREEILNMPSKDIKIFISSDEINVRAEEDVFNIILSWIDHDKGKRKKYFAELFHQVRLVYVSRDYLVSDIVTNDLVKDNEDCFYLVEDAMKLTESKDFDDLYVTPRKSLETSIIAVYGYEAGPNILCYFPNEDKWCCLGECLSVSSTLYPWQGEFVACRGKLYGILESLPLNPESWNESDSFQRQLISYNPYSNSWKRLPYKDDRYLQQIFVTNENEMYALVSEPCKYHGLCRRSVNTHNTEIDACSKEKHVSFIMQYKPESNSWQEVSSFDHLGFRHHFRIVAKGNAIYFIGGEEWGYGVASIVFSDVNRYDLTKDEWSKIPDIPEASRYPWVAALNDKIVVGTTKQKDLLWQTYRCSVYDETTDEWRFIPSPNGRLEKLLAVDGKLYAVSNVMRVAESIGIDTRIECYDADKNEWNLKNETTIPGVSGFTNACSLRIFKGFLSDHQLENFTPCSISGPSVTQSTFSVKCKCHVM